MPKQFAKINPNTNQIIEILVSDKIDYLTENFGGNWVEVKEYHNIPAIGWTWNSDLDNFYEPQPFPSWTLNEKTCIWESPVPKPDDEQRIWSEEYQYWVMPQPTPYRRGDEPPLNDELKYDEFTYEYNFTKKIWEKIKFNYDINNDNWIKSKV